MHIDRVNPLASLIVLSVFTVVEGGAILWTAWTNNIYISYAGYILFGALYAFTITLARLLLLFTIIYVKLFT